MKEEPKKIKLSASKIKTLQNCSWLYQAQYILKVPQKRNEGASRGVCVHIILDCLLNPRHRKHYEFAIKNHNFSSAIQRLLDKHAKKNGVNSSSNMEMMKDMIFVALKNDFFCEGVEKLYAEEWFKIETNMYLIVGYIDKVAVYKDKLRIYDYKTSKMKFNKEELESNVQALIYSLACYKKYGKIPDVEFLFLRFPNQPSQQIKACAKKQLEGFELFLEQISNYLNSFKEEQALADLAANSKERQWLCGKNGCKKDGSLNFLCQYRKPCDYFSLIDENSEILATSFNKSDLHKKPGQKIIKVHYDGCPHFRHENFEDDDPFNFD